MQATMQSPDMKLVRGFSIANIVLSALAIAAFLVGALAIGFGGAILSEPGIYNELASELAADPDIAAGMHELYYEDGYVIDEYDVANIVAWSMGALVVICVIAALVCTVSLIAGILGLKNHDKPEKLGAAFGWSIAGAVCAFLCGRMISTVLLVLEAVYIHKVRQATNAPSYSYAQAQMGAAQPGQYYGQQPAYGQYGQQPAYGQYAAPGYAAPGYAAQPAYPAAPAQPAAPATSATAAPAAPATTPTAPAADSATAAYPVAADAAQPTAPVTAADPAQPVAPAAAPAAAAPAATELPAAAATPEPETAATPEQPAPKKDDASGTIE